MVGKLVKILAIDPGQLVSGWAILDDGVPGRSGIYQNAAMLADVAKVLPDTLLAVEMVASYGMPVGKEVFETVRWIGRFQQAFCRPEAVHFVYRRDVKLELCGSMQARDAHIRQALIDRLGPVGTKKKQGPLYGVKSHAWAALAVAVTAYADLKPRLHKPQPVDQLA